MEYENMQRKMEREYEQSIKGKDEIIKKLMKGGNNSKNNNLYL